MHFIRQAFSDGVQRYALEAEEFIDMCHILLIARNPIEGFGAENVEQSGPGIGKKLSQARPAPDARTGDRLVMIAGDDLPAFLRGQFPADQPLVVDGARVLEIGGVTCVEGCCGHWGSGDEGRRF
ncbi:hypothetical protein SCLO_1015780 [Sphingobium cloacae]|uniref:Uncharacterized protein n=1 Tax=Sphingobium cloacae TaxID=120107 RepID=A0A1E1F273_9SPHN|nr:hypothetical protein SCLO_1015780 [Sphingobium cloacae]